MDIPEDKIIAKTTLLISFNEDGTSTFVSDSDFEEN